MTDRDPSTTEHEVVAGLAAALEPRLGAVEITDLARLSAGANRETWRFDATTTDGTVHELIMQRERAGADRLDGTCAREAQILRVAGAHGVPVAEVVVSSVDLPADANPLDRSFSINRRLAGETIARKILRDDEWADARAAFVDDCARALTAIHSLGPDDLPGIDLPDVPDALGTQVALYDALADPHPTFDFAIRWLEANRPEPTGHTLVHGDFRLGNLLLNHQGLAAALDWEIARYGDPMEDLSWLCVPAWRFGGPKPVAGMGEHQELLDAYAAAGGARLPLDTLRWWEIFGTLRWGVICLQLGGDFRSGKAPSLEMATIGRRVVENEYDLLELLP